MYVYVYVVPQALLDRAYDFSPLPSEITSIYSGKGEPDLIPHIICLYCPLPNSTKLERAEVGV